MDKPSPTEHCQACGAALAPRLRYCLACYTPVVRDHAQALHQASARLIPTTRRSDPTLVALPASEREARARRKSQTKAIAITGALVLVMAVAGGVVWTLVSRENEKQQQAMARDSMARRELTLLAEALERFNADLGRYPTSEEGISLLHRRPASKVLAQWAGPYVDGIYEVDPWGSDYVYRPTPDARQFELFTYGPAGAEAGQVYLSVTSTR